MIEKLSYVSVTGPKAEFDRVLDQYLSEYDIHLENTYLDMNASEHVVPAIESNPYRDFLTKAEELVSLVDLPKKKSFGKVKVIMPKTREMTREEAESLISGLFDQMGTYEHRKSELKTEMDADSEELEHYVPFRTLDVDLEQQFTNHRIDFRYGRIPKDAWNSFMNYSDPDVTSLFTKCSEDSDYIWGVYFVPEKDAVKVDSVYASLRIERVNMPKVHKGAPSQIYQELTQKLEVLNQEYQQICNEEKSLLAGQTEDLFSARNKMQELTTTFEARKMAVYTKDSELTASIGASYFILSGWMSKKDAAKLTKQLDADEGGSFCIVENNPVEAGLKPPTKIVNKGPAKPFELFTKMYGLPAYGEIDPTIILCITYSFIFGAMFGDVGHGAVLIIIGLLLYFLKKSNLGGIIACAGVFATAFGFLYGSFFGFENIIRALWLQPREAMMGLNFVGRLNTVFVIAILFGMGIILLGILLNIILAIKQKEFKNVLCASNGVAGFIFYAMVVLIVILYMSGKPLPATVLVIIFIGVPALAMALNEPLTNLLNKRKALETGVGIFCVEAFFELFEICLTFFSNTLSFVRIGAFALSHAAIMEVVLQLTGYANGHGNIFGLIIGNIIVIGFEGLIVGIQVLRLEYYEIFSKFYKGSGREFKPFFNKRRSH